MEKKIKILLVDDDKDLLQVLQVALEMTSSFRVVTSVNGQEALFKFRNEDFDLIISDLKMPKMDGVEFIHSVLKTKEVPVFVISASLEAFKFKLKEYKTRDIKNVHFLPKPFDPDELSQRVKDCMKSAQAQVPKDVTPTDTNHFKFSAGQIVFEEKSTPEDVFIVKEGTFGVYKLAGNGYNVPVTVVRPGEVVGEMAVFFGGVRTTTVRAETDGVLIRLPLDKVKETLNGQPPWFKVLMKTVSMRLSETTSALAEARAELGEHEKKVKKEA